MIATWLPLLIRPHWQLRIGLSALCEAFGGPLWHSGSWTRCILDLIQQGSFLFTREDTSCLHVDWTITMISPILFSSIAQIMWLVQKVDQTLLKSPFLDAAVSQLRAWPQCVHAFVMERITAIHALSPKETPWSIPTQSLSATRCASVGSCAKTGWSKGACNSGLRSSRLLRRAGVFALWSLYPKEGLYVNMLGKSWTSKKLAGGYTCKHQMIPITL